MSKLKLSAKKMAVVLTETYYRGYQAGYARCEQDWHEAAEEIARVTQSSQLDSDTVPSEDDDSDEEEERCADDEDAHSDSEDDDEGESYDANLYEWAWQDWQYFTPVNLREKLLQHPVEATRNAIMEILDVIEGGSGKIWAVSFRSGYDTYKFSWEMPSRQPMSPFSAPQPSFVAEGRLQECLKRAQLLVKAYHQPANPFVNYVYIKKDGVQYRYSHNNDGTVKTREREIAPYVYVEG